MNWNRPLHQQVSNGSEFSHTLYSPLRQIDSTNVHNLREAWAWDLPVSRNEIAPLVHDGIIFIKSANTIQALDGRTGDLLWQYARALPRPSIMGAPRL